MTRGRLTGPDVLSGGWIRLALLVAASAPAARAATIQVDSTSDLVQDSGSCTLREAILSANTDTPSGATSGECAAGNGSDEIVFAGPGTIVLSGTPLPMITEDLMISGLGAAQQVVDANDQSRVLEIGTGVVVELSGMTLTNGRSEGFDGGGILNEGQLTVLDAVLSDNKTDFNGGGIHNTGILTVWRSRLAGNSAQNGGGIYTDAGSTEAYDTVFDGNLTGGIAPFGGGGGAILSTASSLAVDACTFVGNIAGNGGAIVATLGTGQTSTVANSTFSSNEAILDGGGLVACCGAILTVEHSTFFGNRADRFGNGTGEGGGLDLTTTNLLTSVIVAGNVVGTGTVPDDIFGTVNAASTNNVIGVDSGFTGISDGVGGNQIGPAASPLDPVLGPLADNGGPTETHALLTGSPAIDAGSPLCPPPATDQRGFLRVDGACDVGAYEVGAAEPIFLDGFESGDTTAWSDVVP